MIDALANHGVARSRFVVAGYGWTQPESAGSDSRNRAINRRVEFVLDGRRRPGRALTIHGYTVIAPEAQR